MLREEDGGSGSGFTAPFTAHFLIVQRDIVPHFEPLTPADFNPSASGGNWSGMPHNTTNADIKRPLHSRHEAKVTDGQNCIDSVNKIHSLIDDKNIFQRQLRQPGLSRSSESKQGRNLNLGKQRLSVNNGGNTLCNFEIKYLKTTQGGELTEYRTAV